MTSILTPTDDIVGPIVHQLALVLSSQITGIGRMYEEVPDGPPENNSVLFPLTSFKFEGDTNGKEYVRLQFGIRYMVRRSNFATNLQACYKMFSAMSRVLAAWYNQPLYDSSTGTQYAIQVTPKSGGFTQFVDSGMPYVALILNTEVLTEFNILT